ncbi:hypothetical protein DERF_004945 [Dermatophagoides farinae]|uniref:Uncharacterized protein n=1 Tax=Dermatophagoides farinae TaxID=6954 RepID=A0A922L6N9_DERFA|nr:hypothetical protein DERF_004945 [Dermatophagoides farinae]
MANDSSDDVYDVPGIDVTGSFAAFIRSGSISDFNGYGPIPRMPFSLWNVIFISKTARRAIRSRTVSSFDVPPEPSSRNIIFSIGFSKCSPLKIVFT